MKYEIKQLNDTNAVIISDEETLSNNGDYFLGHPNYDKLLKWNMPEKTQHEGKQIWIKKVIATISPFKIGGLPMLELPNQEEDIEKLALIDANSVWCDETTLENEQRELNGHVIGFIEGYKAAQKQYSEDDMRKAFETGRNYQLTGENNFNELLQSQQKIQFPTSVELTEDLKVIKWYYK